MSYSKLAEILQEVNDLSDLREENIIQKIKERLQGQDEYKPWEEDNFDINYQFKSQYIMPWTLLHCAVHNGYENVVNLLLKVRGINVNAISKFGNTPLHDAVRSLNTVRGRVKVVKLLIDGGADSLLENRDGKTPRDLTTNKDVIYLLEAEEKQLKQGDHQEPNNSLYSSNVDHNQNEPSFLRKHKWEIGVGIGTIAIAVTAFVVLLLTTNLPVAIIGAAFVLIAGGIVGGVTYMISKPSTEIEKVAENKIEQHAHGVVKVG